MTIHRTITREQAADMAQAHAEGYHAELPREGCPECEDQPLRNYPTADQLAQSAGTHARGEAR